VRNQLLIVNPTFHNWIPFSAFPSPRLPCLSGFLPQIMLCFGGREPLQPWGTTIAVVRALPFSDQCPSAPHPFPSHFLSACYPLLAVPTATALKSINPCYPLHRPSSRTRPSPPPLQPPSAASNGPNAIDVADPPRTLEFILWFVYPSAASPVAVT
jgi:hypothetical protein